MYFCERAQLVLLNELLNISTGLHLKHRHSTSVALEATGRIDSYFLTAITVPAVAAHYSRLTFRLHVNFSLFMCILV
jgi:hypothetical protein